jgi:signal peptidase
MFEASGDDQMPRPSSASDAWSSRLSPAALRRLLGRAGLLGSLALFLAWFVLLRPIALGGPAAYTIVTGASMEPGMHAGDLVVSLRGDAYQAGDAVVYRIPAGEDYAGRLVIHRIVGGDAASGFVLQGDNAAHRDPWRVGPDDVVGHVAAHLPAFGRVVIFVRNPFVVGSLAAGFVFVLIVWPRDPRRGEGDRPSRRTVPGNRPGTLPA